MKKICIPILLIFVLSLSIGCSSTEKESSFDVEYQKLDFNIALFGGELATCCFVTSNDAIFSLGSRNSAQEGPLVNTRRIVIYDLEKDAVKQSFDLNKDEYIYNVVSYEDGIIYSNYQKDGETTTWSIVYHPSVDNTVNELVIDSGTCSDIERIPELSVFNGTPIYLYEDSSNGYTYGIKSIEDLKTKEIYSGEKGELYSVNLYLNENTYCFSTVNADASFIHIGDLSGVTNTYDVNGQLYDFDINDNYIVYATSDGDNSALTAIDLTSGNEYTSESDTQYFRLKGSGDKFLCVDSSYNLFSLDITDTVTKTKFDVPDELKKQSPAALFFSMNTNKYLVQFTVDDMEEYYLMTIK